MSSLPERPQFALLSTEGFATRSVTPSRNLSVHEASPAGHCVCSSAVHCPECSRNTVFSVTDTWASYFWILKCPNAVWFFHTPSLHAMLLAPTSLQQSNVCESLICLFGILPWTTYPWNITHFCSPTREPQPLGCPFHCSLCLLKRIFPCCVQHLPVSKWLEGGRER